MSNITRYDPFDLIAFRPTFNRLFSEPFFKDFDFGGENILPIDVKDDGEGRVIVEASLPGFKKEEIEVELANGLLTISARRDKEEEEKKNGKYFRKERSFGSISRTIALPGAVDGKHVNAELKDGVLRLRIPQAPEAQSTKVKIS